MCEFCRTEVFIEGYNIVPVEFAVTELEERGSWQLLELPEDVYFELHTIGSDEHWTNDIEGRFFPNSHFVAISDDEGKECETHFMTETEAVANLKKEFAQIPKDYTTLEQIANDYDFITAYWHVSKSNICPPITTKLIQCLIESVKQ